MYNGFPSTTVYPNTSGIYPSPFPFSLLVYDRTQADVDYRNALHSAIIDGTATSEQLEEWLSDTLKGAYNHSDLNRIGNMLKSIKYLGTSKGFDVTYPYAIKTDYSRTTLPTTTNIAQLLANVSAVRTTFSQWISDTVPANIKTYENANVIEWILYQVDAIYTGVESAFRYSRETYCGGDF